MITFGFTGLLYASFVCILCTSPNFVIKSVYWPPPYSILSHISLTPTLSKTTNYVRIYYYVYIMKVAKSIRAAGSTSAAASKIVAQKTIVGATVGAAAVAEVAVKAATAAQEYIAKQQRLRAMATRRAKSTVSLEDAILRLRFFDMDEAEVPSMERQWFVTAYPHILEPGKEADPNAHYEVSSTYFKEPMKVAQTTRYVCAVTSVKSCCNPIMFIHSFVRLVCLPVCLSACLPVCLSACLCVCLSDCLSVCLSASRPYLLFVFALDYSASLKGLP